MKNIIDYISQIDINVLTIALIMIFFILERFIYSPFKFEKRGIHSFTNFSLFVISFFDNLKFKSPQKKILCPSW